LFCLRCSICARFKNTEFFSFPTKIVGPANYGLDAVALLEHTNTPVDAAVSLCAVKSSMTIFKQLPKTFLFTSAFSLF